MDFDPRDIDSRDDARSPDRDHELRDREFDPSDAFTRDLNLPRSHERHLVLVKTARVADYLNITDEELRRSMTGLWERRRQLKAVGQSG